MLTRIREKGAGFQVTVFAEDVIYSQRETDSLVEAFAMQKAVQGTGKWPDGEEIPHG